MSELDRWHLYGVEGCVHEHDAPFHVAIEQARGGSCDCPEHAAAETATEETT